MDYGLLGSSGLVVSALGFGSAGFSGTSEFFDKIGTTSLAEAERQVAICIDAGVNLFDTSNAYSAGESERILGQALGAKRKQIVLCTKGSLRLPGMDGPNDVGASRHNLIQACEASLRQLRTDWIDLYQLHCPDALTPLEETLRALDDLVRSGKVRYIGCSNFSGWQLMKGLAISQAQGLERFASQQIYYSMVGRDAENELVPLAIDQRLGILVWGPLASGFLSGKFRRGEPMPGGTRLAAMPEVPKVPDYAHGHDILDAVRDVAAAHGATPSQVALNWLRQKPWVSSVIIGARNEAQLRDNLGCLGWTLSENELDLLDRISTPRSLPYPYWTQRMAAPERNPPLSARSVGSRKVAAPPSRSGAAGLDSRGKH